MASPSRCKLDTKGNWKLPVKLSLPSLCLFWKSSPAGSAKHPALGSCPHLVDYKLPAARRIKGGGPCQVHQGRNVSDSTSEDRPHIGEHVSACSLAQSVLSDSVDSWTHRLMDYSPPGSSVHGILQARTLE